MPYDDKELKYYWLIPPMFQLLLYYSSELQEFLSPLHHQPITVGRFPV